MGDPKQLAALQLEQSVEYMEYMEGLAKNLPRVLYVHGAGQEVIQFEGGEITSGGHPHRFCPLYSLLRGRYCAELFLSLHPSTPAFFAFGARPCVNIRVSTSVCRVQRPGQQRFLATPELWANDSVGKKKGATRQRRPNF